MFIYLEKLINFKYFNSRSNRFIMLKIVIVPALICILGVGFVEYCVHKYMKPYVSKTTKSYHITLNNIFVWPAASRGAYCKDYKEAQKQFNKCVMYDPTINYKIVCYPAAVTGYLFPRIIGVSDEVHQVLKENKC